MNTHRNIYFVRHGQTNSNLPGGVAQILESELNEQGVNQATILGGRIKNNFSFDVLITSELKRAIQTGAVIEGLNPCDDIRTNSLLNERLKPSYVMGHKKESDVYLQYVDDFKKFAHDSEWRPEDGESLKEIIVRVQNFSRYLRDETKGDVLVVAHGFYLRILIAYLLTNTDDVNAYVHALDSIRFENTGITHVKLYQDGLWQFGSINDSTHLS